MLIKGVKTAASTAQLVSYILLYTYSRQLTSTNENFILLI